MEKFGVRVSVVEPGNYNSAIIDTTRRRMERRDQSPAGSLFEEELQQMMDRPSDRSRFTEPDEVSAAFLQALFDDNPKRRYMVVPNQSEAEITIKKAIEELVQLNEGHKYSYDREQLIAMLDEALAVSTH